MTIVAGTDFSGEARSATTVAALLAARLHDELGLVHVVDEIRPGPPLTDQSLVAHAARCLEEETLRLLPGGAGIRQEILVGSPDEGLVEAAGRLHGRLVVVGARGSRSSPRVTLGRVAERTAQASPVPVLVVREARALEAWLSGEAPLRVVAGVDLTPTSGAALGWARGLRALGAIDLAAAHAYIPSLEERRLGIHESDPGLEKARAVERVLARDLAAMLRGVPDLGDCRIVVRGAYARTAQTLVEIATAERADLLVVGTHQRHGLERAWYGSVSQGALHMAPMAVACVPAPPEPRVPAWHDVTRVLVPTDFSDDSRRALAYACGMLPRGGVVHLLHVLAERPDDERRARLLAELAGMLPLRASGAGVEAVPDVDHGADAAEAICQAAERHGVDVVCVGSHGLSGMARAVLGSVSDEVMRRCRRPVLVVRPPRDI